MSSSTFYVTTPIYYVNDKPHIGHAYTTILADVISRYNRLMGTDTFFLTGTDEHGQKVSEAAAKLGRTPLEHCDVTVRNFLELWEKLEITNDDFIRTTEENHKSVVREILQDLFDRELIYKGSYEGWYCTPCERFFTEKDLVDGLCPECERDVKQIEEANYFFKMGKYQDWLIGYIEENPGFVQPEFRKNEVLGFLRKGPLGDLCISRPKSRLDWGIELPFDPEYVCYVWFDALINYISAAGYRRDDEKFKKWWPATYHLIGKDILTTHAVYWPTMLKAMEVEMPRTVFAHGWWLTRNSKMSKSLGNVVNPMDMIDTYGVDPFRFFLIAEMSLGKDCNFSEEGFVRRYNAELANDLGNLLNRVISMIDKHCEGAIPEPGEPGTTEAGIRAAAEETCGAVGECVSQLTFDRMVEKIFEFVRAVNKYFDTNAPWKMIKEGDRDGFCRVMYHSAEALRIISGLLYPIMPEKMSDLRKILGITADVPDLSLLRQWGTLKPGTPLGEREQLFPRVELAETAEPEKKGKKADKEKKEETGDIVTFDQFGKIKLRAARVLECEAVPKSNKLLRLIIDLGEEKRQIVAGVGKHYTPEEMIGRTIVIVANLKKSKIFGVESEGMLLAADTGNGFSLITCDSDVPPGSSVG